MVVTQFRDSLHFELSQRADPDPGDVEILAREAAKLAGQGELARALGKYQVALLMDESRADLWFNYGVLQLRMGQVADAVESLEFALRQDQTLYPARYRLGRICFDTGRPLEALSHFHLVAQQRPGYIPAWRYIVQITWALGNLAEAEAHAREALGHAHDDEVASMLERIVADRGEA